MDGINLSLPVLQKNRGREHRAIENGRLSDAIPLLASFLRFSPHPVGKLLVAFSSCVQLSLVCHGKNDFQSGYLPSSIVVNRQGALSLVSPSVSTGSGTREENSQIVFPAGRNRQNNRKGSLLSRFPSDQTLTPTQSFPAACS